MMESHGIAFLAASLLRPLGLAAAAWLVLRVLRVRHPASRHAVWTAVLIGMMLLPLVSVMTPHWKLPVLPRKHDPAAKPPVAASTAFADSALVDSDTRIGTATGGPSADQPAARFEWPATDTLVLWCYLVGAAAMMTYRLVGWALLWRVVSRSRPLRSRRVLESPDVLTPVAVGVLKPAVLLPAGWRNWDANTRRAVLAHEFAHLRRRDTLVSALARFVQCVFWFHPLAWWLSRKISDLAELACDAVALEKLDDPAGYSRILLEFARAVNRAGQRVALPGLAMATRSGMGRRIDHVFELSRGSMRKLARPGVLLPLMGVPVMCLAATIGLGEYRVGSPRLTVTPTEVGVRTAPPIVAPTQPAVVDAPPARVPAATQMVAQQTAPPPQAPLPAPQQNTPVQSAPPQNSAPPAAVAPAPAARPEFEVASIKPCTDSIPPGGRGGGRSGPGGGTNQPTGRLNIRCQTVNGLIMMAYALYANGQGNPLLGLDFPIDGLPAWTRSDRYDIEAKADGDAKQEMMRGPMMQALLEDRFQLKVHHETREVPVYLLTVAKNGPKMPPFQEGSCVPLDLAKFPPAALQPGEQRCPGTGRMKGPNMTVDVQGITVDDFAKIFLRLDRPVFNRTGIAGKYNFSLEWAPDETAPGGAGRGGDRGGLPVATPDADDPAGVSIFTAVQQQLGLKLEPAKGPREFLVIDHVEKPSGN
jgi:uncharacterized protein (TIGR03435 family)